MTDSVREHTNTGGMQEHGEDGCPVWVGETFAVPLEALELELGANVRAVDRSGLGELAESMARVGQLAPILVFWTGERFRIAAGYRRALAMALHRERFGFVAILARRIEAEAADLVRLVENFERENPSTFETCRYLYELQRGLNGRRKTSAAEIGEAIGRSTHYVQNLIRFYRVLPEEARSAWAADGDRRFTFRVLHELSRLADGGSDEALRARLTQILGAAPSTPQPPSPRPRSPRGMSRSRAKTLLKALESAGARVREDDRAVVAQTLLQAFCGAEPASAAEATVRGLLAELGLPGGAHDR